MSPASNRKLRSHSPGNGVATEGGVLDEEDFSIWLDWLDAEGEVDADALDVSEIYTNEFNPYAEEK